MSALSSLYRKTYDFCRSPAYAVRLSNVNQDFIILNIAVFAASALQSATGIGFGVIAGPILLVALNDGSAIQISIVLNLLIATLLAPSLRHDADTALLKKLVTGLLVGSPVGFLIFLTLDLAWLKAFAGLAVLFTLLVTVRGLRNSSGQPAPVAGNIATLSIGAIAGMMGASLAMPGPIPAAWMSVRGFSKEKIRATILLMFVFAYAIALALQFAASGISADTLRLCVMLAPATIVGILAGRVLGGHISEQIFRRALVIILAATAVTLFLSLI
jgi:uncharacterized membrane protein YfcA